MNKSVSVLFLAVSGDPYLKNTYFNIDQKAEMHAWYAQGPDFDLMHYIVPQHHWTSPEDHGALLDVALVVPNKPVPKY